MPFSNFAPAGATVTLAVTGATDNIQVGAGNVNFMSIRVANLGDNPAFIVLGQSDAVEATEEAGMPIMPGTVESFDVSANPELWIAGIGTGSTLYITPGNGA